MSQLCGEGDLSTLGFEAGVHVGTLRAIEAALGEEADPVASAQDRRDRLPAWQEAGRACVPFGHADAAFVLKPLEIARFRCPATWVRLGYFAVSARRTPDLAVPPRHLSMLVSGGEMTYPMPVRRSIRTDGHLTLTNQRLVFEGEGALVEIALLDVLARVFYPDALEVRHWDGEQAIILTDVFALSPEDTELLDALLIALG
ncbi:MAG: hypothetical protein LPL00_06480 [Alphaproteobacteria bacterium]|nr:hypothetical protein [Alphaproteobacteria bacterium]MDX5369193.1 hypothetical protein [Alphaproteobacteria bacterium]MDX5463889.1 hypothetical protein [Alphaproteobacteria bacterium]